MKTIFSRDFLTPVGMVRTYITSDRHGEVKIDGFNITTEGHLVKIEEFELRNDWLPEKMSIETSIGWRWFVIKTNEEKENLTIFCELINPSVDTAWHYESGEHLSAVLIENKTHELHIGTEDEDALALRSEKNDWIPNRFQNKLGLMKNPPYTMTEYIDFGFKTPIPELRNTERIYFHFLVATNKIKPDIQYPNQQDCSTWFAVDQSKKFLDKYLEV